VSFLEVDLRVALEEIGAHWLRERVDREWCDGVFVTVLKTMKGKRRLTKDRKPLRREVSWDFKGDDPWGPEFELEGFHLK